MSSALSADFLRWLAHFRFSNTYKFLISGQKHSVGIHFLNKIARKTLVIKLLGFAKIFYSSFWLTETLCYIIINDGMCYCVWRHIMQKSVTLKIVYNKKRKNFVMNIPIISSHEARKNCISFVALPLIKCAFFASLDKFKWHIHSKNLNILFNFHLTLIMK